MTTTHFRNVRQCIAGQLISKDLTISPSGLITNLSRNYPPPNIKVIDLQNAIIAPGFIELQTNGALGFHFSHASDPETYSAGVRKLARYLPSTGVTGFYPTVPTVNREVFKQVLPFLGPREGDEGEASVLGAHVEGPFLAHSKKGAHDAANMYIPSTTSLEEVYGEENLKNNIKICTIAPELPGALGHIKKLRKEYGISVSMGHSAATYEQGIEGTKAGAGLVTHLFNAMNGLHHREPGLPVVSLTYRSSPSHTILITDSIELSGLKDGVYPGHAQIPHPQLKTGNKVTIQGTDTLIGTCIGLDECVQNLIDWAGIKVEEAVMCVTENVVAAVGVKDRGALEVGRRGDFVVLDEEGRVLSTWILGWRVWSVEGV